jgi:thiamine-monophosphate kinase
MSDTVTDFGEKRIVSDIYVSMAARYHDPRVVVDIGDDAGVTRVGIGKCVIGTVDRTPDRPVAFAEGVMDYYGWGYYSAMANISDIASMGGTPIGLLTSFALPSDFLLQDVDALSRGLNDAASLYGTKVISGDTGGSPRLVSQRLRLVR